MFQFRKDLGETSWRSQGNGLVWVRWCISSCFRTLPTTTIESSGIIRVWFSWNWFLYPNWIGRVGIAPITACALAVRAFCSPGPRMRRPRSCRPTSARASAANRPSSTWCCRSTTPTLYPRARRTTAAWTSTSPPPSENYILDIRSQRIIRIHWIICWKNIWKKGLGNTWNTFLENITKWNRFFDIPSELIDTNCNEIKFS